MTAPLTDSTQAAGAFVGLIGVAREDITPPIGIYARNWGAATHDVAEGIHRPLTLTTLTLQTEPDAAPLVLAVADLGWWRSGGDEWHVRGRALDQLAPLGLDVSRLLLSFTHTHAGPALCRDHADRPGGEFILPYLDRLTEALAQTTRRALASAQPANLEWAWGRCDLARNRDFPDPNGARILCGYNPDGPLADDTLLVGRVTAAENGRPLATLVNYACHPTTLAWQNRLLSPDFVGALREVVEARTEDAPCLFLQGASGELTSCEQLTDDVTIVDAHGEQLGFAVLSTLRGMLPPRTRLAYAGVVESGAPLATWRREPASASTALSASRIEVEFPLKPMASLAEIERDIAATTDRALRERLERKRLIRQWLGEDDSALVPLWRWQIGGAFLLAHPNEAYSHLQTELRARFAPTPLVVLNVTNGHFGYLPPADFYTQDIYPVWQTPFDAGSLDRLIAAADRALRL